MSTGSSCTLLHVNQAIDPSIYVIPTIDKSIYSDSIVDLMLNTTTTKFEFPDEINVNMSYMFMYSLNQYIWIAFTVFIIYVIYEFHLIFWCKLIVFNLVNHMNDMIIRDLLECIKMNNPEIQLQSVKTLQCKNNKMKYESNNELQIMIQISLFILNQNSMNELMYRSMLCFLEFTTNFISNYMDKQDASNNLNVAISASYTNLNRFQISHIWIKCVKQMLSQRDESIFIEDFLNELIQIPVCVKFPEFVDLCRDNDYITDLSEFYLLCDSYEISQEWLQTIMPQLNLLLMYEDDNNVLINTLKSCIQFMFDDLIDENIEIIINNQHSIAIKNKYLLKQKKNNALFGGFIREFMLNEHIEYIPNDIMQTMFIYFNCYQNGQNPETDLFHRLMVLFMKNNGYSQEIRELALKAMCGITYFCDNKIGSDLIYKYELLNIFEQLLMNGNDFLNFEFFTVIYNITFEQKHLIWNSNIIGLMMKRFNQEIMSNLLNAKSIFLSLFDLIESVNEYELDIMIRKYELIQSICKFMCKIVEYQDSHHIESFDGNQILDWIFDLIQQILEDNYNRNLCISELTKYEALNLFIQICNKCRFSLQNRANHIILQYFDANYDDNDEYVQESN